MKHNIDCNKFSLSIGIATCAVLAGIGIVLLLLHPSAFWVGVGICLALGGGQASWNCYRTSRDLPSQPEPAIGDRSLTLREWWTTPKRYPSGDKFTPRESAIYGSLCILGIVGCLSLTGLAAQAIVWGLHNR